MIKSAIISLALIGFIGAGAASIVTETPTANTVEASQSSALSCTFPDDMHWCVTPAPISN